MGVEIEVGDAVVWAKYAFTTVTMHYCEVVKVGSRCSVRPYNQETVYLGAPNRMVVVGKSASIKFRSFDGVDYKHRFPPLAPVVVT